MDSTDLKIALLHLLAEDTEVRAALLALVDDPVRLKAVSGPPPAPTMTDAVSRLEIPQRPGPGWLKRGNYLAR